MIEKKEVEEFLRAASRSEVREVAELAKMVLELRGAAEMRGMSPGTRVRYPSLYGAEVEGEVVRARGAGWVVRITKVNSPSRSRRVYEGSTWILRAAELERL